MKLMSIIMNRKKKILLHTCCAPCLIVAEERLRSNFEPIIFWYNPNIEPIEEHDKRLTTLKNFLDKARIDSELIGSYDYTVENKNWHKFIAGLENEPEGGKRCKKCFEFRLKATMEQAENFGFGLFATTLTVSPHKDSKTINKIGKEIVTKHAVAYQVTKFRADNGYQRSIELSKKYGLYRQKFCGCRYSVRSNQSN